MVMVPDYVGFVPHSFYKNKIKFVEVILHSDILVAMMFGCLLWYQLEVLEAVLMVGGSKPNPLVMLVKLEALPPLPLTEQVFLGLDVNFLPCSDLFRKWNAISEPTSIQFFNCMYQSM